MGFEVYLQCFAGESSGISRDSVRALFPIVEESSEPDHWSVRYDGVNSCRIHVTPAKSNNELITALGVSRPCGDVRFWESMLAILRMGSVILYWPGGGPLVASQLVADELPQEITEMLGQAQCVHSARDIMDAIRES
jgi:hypothetical protein